MDGMAVVGGICRLFMIKRLSKECFDFSHITLICADKQRAKRRVQTINPNVKTTDVKKPPEGGFLDIRNKLNYFLIERVPTTSISVRRFLALPSLVLLSATGCFSPLPSV